MLLQALVLTTLLSKGTQWSELRSVQVSVRELDYHYVEKDRLRWLVTEVSSSSAALAVTRMPLGSEIDGSWVLPAENTEAERMELRLSSTKEVTGSFSTHNLTKWWMRISLAVLLQKNHQSFDTETLDLALTGKKGTHLLYDVKAHEETNQLDLSGQLEVEAETRRVFASHLTAKGAVIPGNAFTADLVISTNLEPVSSQDRK